MKCKNEQTNHFDSAAFHFHIHLLGFQFLDFIFHTPGCTEPLHKEASRGFEPRSLDSESRVLTVTPRGRLTCHRGRSAARLQVAWMPPPSAKNSHRHGSSRTYRKNWQHSPQHLIDVMPCPGKRSATQRRHMRLPTSSNGWNAAQWLRQPRLDCWCGN